MISPVKIELSPEQRQHYYNMRAKRFMDGMHKLTEETGMVLMPHIQYTPEGAMIVLSVVDKPQPVDKPSVSSV